MCPLSGSAPMMLAAAIVDVPPYERRIVTCTLAYVHISG
jgi:hypothetical protein